MRVLTFKLTGLIITICSVRERLNTLDSRSLARRCLRNSNPARGFFLRLLKLLRRESYCVLSLSETYYVECSGSVATVRYDEARHQPSAVTIGLYVRPEFSSKSTEHPEISI